MRRYHLHLLDPVVQEFVQCDKQIVRVRSGIPKAHRGDALQMDQVHLSLLLSHQSRRLQRVLLQRGRRAAEGFRATTLDIRIHFLLRLLVPVRHNKLDSDPSSVQFPLPRVQEILPDQPEVNYDSLRLRQDHSGQSGNGHGVQGEGEDFPLSRQGFPR